MDGGLVLGYGVVHLVEQGTVVLGASRFLFGGLCGELDLIVSLLVVFVCCCLCDVGVI